MELRVIDRNIKRIGTLGTKLNDLIHTTAIAILEHARDHGDCTRAVKLVLAMPKSARRTLLVQWFATYSPIGMNVTSGKVGLVKRIKVEGEPNTYQPFDIEQATANPFYVEQTKEDAEVIPDTLQDVLGNVVKFADRLQKKLDDGSIAADARDAVTAKIAAIRALAA